MPSTGESHDGALGKALGMTRDRFVRALVAPGVLLAATVAAYLNAFEGVFQFDDYNVIVDNPAVHAWESWLAQMPGIRPLLKLSYVANWQSGHGLFGFHLFNLFCHLGNVVLVFLLCRRLAPLAVHSRRRDALAFVVALLFALHPAQTEAVTYISGRSVSFMALCYLGAAYAWLEGRPPWSR